MTETSMSLVPLIQSDSTISVGQNSIIKPWKWSKKKRKAVQLVIQGRSDIQVAKELGVHRHTIRHWRSKEEFWGKVLTEARDYVTRTKFKRVNQTGLITDQLAKQVAKRVMDLTEKDYSSNKDEINALQVFLREYREFRSQERADFGDNVKKIEGKFLHFGIEGGQNQPVQPATPSQSFKDFVTGNLDKVPERLILESVDTQKALIDTTRSLVRSTDILERLHNEDSAESKVDLNAAE